MPVGKNSVNVMTCSVLFFSRPRSEGWPATPWTYFLYSSVSFVILNDFSTGSPLCPRIDVVHSGRA